MKVINRPWNEAKDRPFVAQFIPSEFFVIVNFKDWVIDHTIYWIDGFGPGNKPFKIEAIKNKTSIIIKYSGAGGTGNSFLSEYRLGSQTFDKWITSIEYAQGYTIIGFEDGRLLKIQGTGGTGQHMFNTVESPGGFTHFDTSYQTYLVGSHKFQNPILDIVFIEGKTLVCFKGGKILKVNGTGGTGYNVFAITEYTDTFFGVPGYNYFSGAQKLDSDVCNITVVSGLTLIAFKDGRQIKIGGTGGTGTNMFKIVKTSYGYAPLPWTYELHGSNKFNSYIVKSLVVGGQTFFCYKNGKVMKISGSGGTGQKMFNVAETPGGFETHNTAYTSYLLGDYKFPGDDYVRDLKYINGYTFIVTNNSYVLKIQGTGGTGHNMFNLGYGFNSTAGQNAYQTGYLTYAAYLTGQQIMTTNLSLLEQIIQIDEFIFLTFKDVHTRTSILKLKAIIASSDFVNMFGITLPTDFGQNFTSNGSSTSSYVGCTGVTQGV